MKMLFMYIYSNTAEVCYTKLTVLQAPSDPISRSKDIYRGAPCDLKLNVARFKRKSCYAYGMKFLSWLLLL